MIDPDKRNAVFQLHEAGMPARRSAAGCTSVAIRCEASSGTGERCPRTERKDKIHIDPDLLRRLYGECGGWIQRMHEKLLEEENIRVGYSTLTQMVRELELGRPRGLAAIACRTSRAPRCSTTPRPIG